MNHASIREHWGWFLALGILMILAGTIAIFMPAWAGLTFQIIIGWVLIFAGIINIIGSFTCKTWGAGIWRFFVGLLYGVAGAFMIFNPLKGLITLTLLFAILLIAEGISRIIMGFELRKRASQWGWLVFGGLLSLGLGILIYMKWPSSSFWVLGLFVGIDLIFAGWSYVFLSLASRKKVPVPIEAHA